MRAVVLILIFGFLSGLRVYSCSCDTLDVYESYEQYNKIFLGKIVKSEFYEHKDTLFDDRIFENVSYKYTIEPVAFYKGDSLSEVIVMTDYGSSCHFQLTHGDYYLIYSYNWRGYQRTSMCSRTKNLRDSRTDRDIKILKALKYRNSNRIYRPGYYSSDDNDSYFRFYSSGRFYYRNKKDSVRHGAGNYQFKNDSLYLNFSKSITNQTGKDYFLGKEQSDSIIINIQTEDYDLKRPITDYKLMIKDAKDSILFSDTISEKSKRISFSKRKQIDKIYFSKDKYPDYKVDFCDEDYCRVLLHDIKIKWQEKFIPIENKEKVFRLIDDKKKSFILDDKKNTGYNMLSYTMRAGFQRFWLSALAKFLSGDENASL